MKAPRYERDQLARLILEIIQFAADNYCKDPVDQIRQASIPYELMEPVAYVIACYLASCTPNGRNGVEAETVMREFRMSQHMTNDARAQLVSAVLCDYYCEKS